MAKKAVTMRVVGANETIPALLGGYAPRTCGGEAAVVIRPRDRSCVVVLVQGAVAYAWQSSGATGDAPRAPTRTITPAEAVQLARQAQSGSADVTDIEDKGAWTAKLICSDEGGPVVVLERATSNYLKIRVESNGQEWRWQMDRKKTWFGSETSRSGKAPHLIAAIQAAFEASYKGAEQVCATRDTKVRQSRDAAYAEQRPLRLKAEKPDKISPWEPKAPKSPKAEKPPRAPKAESTPKPPKPPKADKPAKAPKPPKPGKPQSSADLVSQTSQYPSYVDPRVAAQIGYDGYPEPRPFPQASSAAPRSPVTVGVVADEGKDQALLTALTGLMEKKLAALGA